MPAVPGQARVRTNLQCSDEASRLGSGEASIVRRCAAEKEGAAAHNTSTGGACTQAPAPVCAVVLARHVTRAAAVGRARAAQWGEWLGWNVSCLGFVGNRAKPTPTRGRLTQPCRPHARRVGTRPLHVLDTRWRRQPRAKRSQRHHSAVVTPLEFWHAL